MEAKDTEFRGIRKNTGKWIYGSLLIFGKRRFIIPPAKSDFDDSAPLSVALSRWCEVIPETVGQFTGLLDKKCKDGYFGDIVKDEGDRYVVEWDEDMGVAYLRCCQLSNIDLEIEAITAREIIGNIHENPELL